MKYRALALIAALPFVWSAAGADVKKFYGEVKLATPVAQASETTIKGINWKCEGDRCTASSSQWKGLDSFIKQCRIVSESLGPLVAFHASGRNADAGEIVTCNKLAKKNETQQAG